MKNLTNDEINKIILAEKEFRNIDNIVIPKGGSKLELKAFIIENNEYIELRVNSSSISDKYSHHSMTKSNNMLIRVCLNPRHVHVNPDGQKIDGSHIHFFDENNEAKFAQPLTDFIGEGPDDEKLTTDNINNVYTVFKFFCWKLTIKDDWFFQTNV